MKKFSPYIISFAAICIALNYVGSTLALLLKLPIYLDTFGTVLASLVLGPLAGVGIAVLSALISAFTTDISAIYFSPVAILLALLVSIFFKNQSRPSLSLLWKTLLVSLPATILASLITVLVFKGITPSGSSLLVQGLHGLGLDLVSSTVLVQALTDYADRLIVIGVSLLVLPQLKKISPQFSAKTGRV
ncbi:ECF transporter S component [Streptococcus panodentis]|uniref:ECF transporter S component n=1 Tax=Streptococcus panodentis TaxID=1581472 RepID=A0ABS5AUG3_9STRE|nr:ECF transporter S component [Streptococcus panodentis]MBP2620106.1 ECF transporter S component [Streptococcus panodentis]